MGQLRAFEKSVAVVVGIDAYSDGLPALETAVADARAIAALLEAHGYAVRLLVDAEATRAGLERLFEDELPAQIGPDDRLLIYFAGHGTAQDGTDGPEGFLVPHDARSGADARASLLPMSWLHARISALPCRHRLLMLDCCFAGTFRWSGHRSFFPSIRPIFRHRYQRFVDEPAAQVITSAAEDQKALDVIDGLALGLRTAAMADGHSPFAAAVLAGLGGAADTPGPDGRPDGVITASELYLWVREVVERASEARQFSQTPGLWPLPMHGRGEYLFEVPGRPLHLMEDPRLDAAANPWRGLRAYDAEHRQLFFGREPEIARLRGALDGGAGLIAVLGASGSGKSSLVKAGLLPRLGDGWTIVGPIRPGRAPVAALEGALGDLEGAGAGRRVLVVDQLEEVFTRACPVEEQAAFFARLVALSEQPGLSVIVTLRADFEAPVAQTALAASLTAGRFVVPPMSREGLREVIHGPAALRVLYFEPPTLPEALVDEVIGLPGGLPLLSFTLAELYRSYLARDAGDRALREADYVALGGVTGSLRSRASAIHDAAAPAEQDSMRRLMLRLVATDGGELAKRRATLTELTYADPVENTRMARVIDRLVEGRLLVRGTAEADDVDGGGEPYVEPAHDALVLGWDRVYRWMREAADRLPLSRALWRGTRAWAARGEPKGLLWNQDPRLAQAVAIGGEHNALEARFVARSVQQRRRGWWTLAGAVAAVMVLLGGTAIYALGEAARADANAATAKSNGEIAQEKEREAIAAAERAEDAARLAIAERLSETDPTSAALVLAEIKDPNRSSATVQRLIEIAARPGLVRAVLQGHTRGVTSAAFSPDGARVLTTSWDRTARIWEIADARSPVIIRDVDKAVFSPGGGQIATTSRDGAVRVWSADGGGPARMLGKHAAAASSVAFSHDGARIVTASKDETVRIWSVDGSKPPVVLEGHSGPVRSASFSPDGLQVVTSGEDGTVRVWNADGGASTLIGDSSSTFARNKPEGARSAVFSPDGARVLVALEHRCPSSWSADGTGFPIAFEDRGCSFFGLSASFSSDGRRVLATDWVSARVWRSDGAGSPVLLRNPTGLNSGAASFSPDGAHVLTVSAEERAYVWNADGSGTPIALTGHTRGINDAAFSPDGAHIVTASDDGTARVWSANGSNTSIVLEGHTDRVWSAAFSLDGARVVTGSEDNTARVWRADGVGAPLLLTGHTGPVLSTAFSPDGRRVVTASKDKTARVWSVDDAEHFIPLRGHDDPLISAAFSPDGERVLTASRDGTARIWRADGTGSPLVLGSRRGVVWAAALSPDGHRVVTGSSDYNVRVWSADEEGPPLFVDEHRGQVWTVAFSPDGRRIVSGSNDDLVHVYDLDSGARNLLPGHTYSIESAAFSHDGTRFVTGSRDGTARVWNVDRTGSPIVFEGHDGTVFRATFSPDDRLVATAHWGKTARVWFAEADRTPLVLRTPRNPSVAFSPDGRRLLTPCREKDACVWDLDGRVLQRRLDAYCRLCLSIDFRVSQLRETPEAAHTAYHACLKRKGIAAFLDEPDR